MTREEILNYFKDINFMYNNPSMFDTLKRMLDELTEPCEDCVRRADAEKLFRNARKALMEQDRKEHIKDFNTRDLMLLNAEQMIYLLPSVTPERPKGVWVSIDEEPHEDYECDNCGYIISTYTANIEPHTEYKYCPNCGAKMEGVSE